MEAGTLPLGQRGGHKGNVPAASLPYARRYNVSPDGGECVCVCVCVCVCACVCVCVCV